MKDYPSIISVGSHYAPKGKKCIAFKKYDGSNLRFTWGKKKGWHSFSHGKRKDDRETTSAPGFDRNDPLYGCSIDIFLNKYASGMEQIMRKDKHFRSVEEVICFCEFFGPYSFSGQHDPAHPALLIGGCKGSNEPYDLMMFDVNVHRKGFMEPRLFLNTFAGELAIPEVVYEGNLNASFVQDVREGKYPVVEGVVCKGLDGPAPHGIWRVKIKTNAYLDELKKRFAKDWEQYV